MLHTLKTLLFLLELFKSRREGRAGVVTSLAGIFPIMHRQSFSLNPEVKCEDGSSIIYDFCVFELQSGGNCGHLHSSYVRCIFTCKPYSQCYRFNKQIYKLTEKYRYIYR